jgi:type IV secretion system protein VirB6
MAFFMIGCVHLALMFMVMKVANTMVSGWTVFGLSKSDKSDQTPAYYQGGALPASQIANSTAQSRSQQTTPPPARDIRVAANAQMVANDTGSNTTTIRETKIVAGPASSSSQADKSTISRTRGIGNRFKSAPSRSTEKSQQ